MNYDHALSIIIISYNGAAFLERLLFSLRQLIETSNDIELIVVDNNSTDSTGEVLSKWQLLFREQLTIITSSKNLGVAGGRKLGIESSSGKFIMLLDNDTIVTKEAILELRSYLENNPICGVVAPALYSLSGELQESAKPFPGIGIKLRNILINRFRTSPINYGECRLIHPYYVIGACQIFRKTTYDQIGGLDTNIFYGPEDADFCERVRQAGFSIDYIQSISIIHEWQRATRRSLVSKLSFQHLKGLIYFYLKHRRFF